jgi:type IV pilus assembly protein PilN
MMIKINLLPVRQVKKREVSQQILVLYAVLLAAALGGNWYYNHGLGKTIERQQQEIRTTEASIKELEKVIGEVNFIKEREKELKDKLAVLEELRKGRNGPVRILDALATATPAKVWFTNFDEKGGLVKLTGTATSHDDVADLMRQLKSVVWTPKGMGRLVEERRGQNTSRVEILGSGGEMADFNSSEVGKFFDGVELLSATQKDSGSGQAGGRKLVEFSLNFTARYTL